jgi:hypothetical protein
MWRDFFPLKIVEMAIAVIVLPLHVFILLLPIHVSCVFSLDNSPTLYILNSSSFYLYSSRIGPRCCNNRNPSSIVFLAIMLLSVYFLVTIWMETTLAWYMLLHDGCIKAMLLEFCNETYYI